MTAEMFHVKQCPHCGRTDDLGRARSTFSSGEPLHARVDGERVITFSPHMHYAMTVREALGFQAELTAAIKQAFAASPLRRPLISDEERLAAPG